MSDPIILVSVVRDTSIYDRLFVQNKNLTSCKLHMIDNRVDNRGIPTCYNAFLNAYDDSNPAWFVFCHEDFEFREPIFDLINACSKDSIYGPIGVIRVNCLVYSRFPFQGRINVRDRNGKEPEKKIGKRVSRFKEVQTFDCCCMIVHSSLIKRYHLRFDEALQFDFYVEDFCTSARLNHQISSRILQMEVCHYSNSVPTNRLFRHIPYLQKKYPKTYIPSTCGIYGTLPPFLKMQMKIQKVGTTLIEKLIGHPWAADS